MKISELNKDTFDQLVELECQNIIPVLASVGINLDREQMVKELESFKNDEVIYYKNKDVVDGFIVYKNFADHILIKTFNLRSSNNRKTLVNLLIQITKELKDHSIELIKSHCHLTNQKSLNFHRGLGFKEALSNDKFIEFHANRTTILDILTQKCSKL